MSSFAPFVPRRAAAVFSFVCLTAAMALAAPLAQAGPAAEATQARIEAIAKGNEAAITGAYAPGAVLEWVGGPLDGRYATPQALAEVWAKFAKANPDLSAKVSDLREAANPKGATVSADVVFHGKKAAIPVRYVLTWRDGKIVAEIWQVDPALAQKSGY